MNRKRSEIYRISGHAMAQYMERANCQDWAEAESKLMDKLDRAVEVEPPSNAKARFHLKCGNWILIIKGNVLVTCYILSAWQKKRGMWKHLKEAE